MPKQVTISVINDLSGDQRVHRIASTLQENGYEVLVVGRKLPNSLQLKKRSYRTYRMRLLFRRGKLFYLEYNLRLFLFLLVRRKGIFNACDLDTLLANYLASKVKGASLVYDSHEYFTEVPELLHRPRTRHIWLALEHWLLPKLKYAYTVNQSLADAYHQAYGIRMQVIRNLPFRETGKDMRLKSREDNKQEKVIIYQGALNLGRGIELLIDAMEFLPGVRLWIVGKGDVEKELRERAAVSKFAKRIDFKGFVPFEQLHQLTSQADLGISLEEDLGLNYRFATPNKVYDYIQAGLPVLVSDLPEMRRIVETHGVGEMLEESERNPERLAEKIKKILSDSIQYRTQQKNCTSAAAKLNWEQEQGRLLEIYRFKEPRLQDNV